MSTKKIHWKDFVDERDDFQLSTYMYLLINQIMKNTLDLGTLLSDDPKKLRAFKEQIKKNHKEAWSDVAESLESYGLIDRCTCRVDENCEICKGSRYVPSDVVNAELLIIPGRAFVAPTNEEEAITVQRKLLNHE
jgi:hypothetical protein